MPLFKKKSAQLNKKNARFKKKIAEANRLLNNLDHQIAVFKSKYQTLRMRGREEQSVSELEWMLRQMHIQAEQAQALINECQIEHEDCVKLVGDLTEMFESSLDSMEQDQI